MRLDTRKIVSILIVAVMILSIFIPNIALAIEGTPIMNVSVTKGKVQRGEEFTATVNLNTNGSTDVEGIEMELTYDASVLEVVSSNDLASSIGGLSDMNTAISGKVVYVVASSNAINYNAALFNVTFRVKSDAVGGSTILQIKGANNSSQPLSNEAGDGIFTDKTNGSVDIDIPTQSISLNKTTIDLYETENDYLEVLYTPTDTTNKGVTWNSSDLSVAAVMEDGTVTAISRGTATITATTKDGFTATCTVNVKREIGSITLNKNALSLDKGQSEKLTVTIPDDSDGDKTITWTSTDTSVATVDNNGNVTGVNKGTAQITAETSNGKKALCTVVVGVSLKSISFEGDITEKTLQMGVENEDSLKLNVLYNPEDADIDPKTLKWESTDTSVATVSEDGTVTAKGQGETKITARINEQEASCLVHVKVPILSITIKDNTELTYGEEEKLDITYNTYNQLVTTDDKTIKWESSDTNILDVTVDGTIITKAAGTATVTATLVVNENIKATCEVTVNPAPLQSVVIEEQSIVMEKGDIQKLHVKFNPDKTTDSKEITWESDNTEAVTVDATGVLTALGNGTATITASTESGLKATTTVTVVTTLKDVKISETDVTINKGVPLTLIVTLDPIDATLDDSTIKWESSNTEVATVNQSGEVTTHKAGTAYIYATVGGITKECKITVNVPLTGITMETKLILLKGQNKILTVTKEPEGTNFSGKITFDSSDTKHVTVDKEGKIEAISATEENTPVTVTANAIENDVIVATATCTVEVIEIPLDSIAINQADFSLGLGRTQKLSIIYNPEETTDDKTVRWISANPEVATIDQNGLVTAKTVGEAEIIATVNGKEARVIVTTHEIPITAIKVYTNLSNNKLAIGKAVTLTVKVEPEDATRQGNYKFTSSNENIVTVDEKGNVIAHGLGKTLITVETENGIKEQVEIEVVSDSAAAAAAYKRLSPKTGDIKIELFTTIMVVSALGMAIIFIINKKNR